MSELRKNIGRIFDERKFRITNSISDWVRVIDNDGFISFVNQSMIDEFGVDPKGLNIWEEIDERVVPRCISTRNFRFNGVIREERKIKGRYFSIQSSPIRDDQKNIIGTVEVFRDITSEINARIDLIEANKKMHDEINFAKLIQRNILPKKGRHGDLNVDYRYISSETLSGDIFDIIEIDNDHVAIYIADIVGHGVAASILTMFVRQTVRSIVNSGTIMPKDVLQELKIRYKELDLDDDKYFTMFYGIYNRKTGFFTCSNAGHNAIPIKFNNDFSILMESSGFPISYLFVDSVYEQKDIKLHNGDKILFYTDGITEVKNYEGEEFGESRLQEIVKKNRNRLLDDIVDAIEWYRWGEQEDDLCLLLIEVDQIEEGIS
ncbi:MAG: SpoIIE family protein phosphatase [Tissierellia bacterium]|nr:SpoIIE family protein phosphatase [Tissierellia bacterium]